MPKFKAPSPENGEPQNAYLMRVVEAFEDYANAAIEARLGPDAVINACWGSPALDSTKVPRAPAGD